MASQGVSVPPGSLAGLDLGQQLQQIVRGELRRMLEVIIIWASTQENLSSGFPIKWYSNPPAQLQRLARNFKVR